MPASTPIARTRRPLPAPARIGRRSVIAVAIGIAAVAAWWLWFRPSGCGGPLDLPEEFCATVFADDVGPARHLAVAPNGTVYVATWREGQLGGGIVALRDTNGDGSADVRAKFGPEGGSGIAIADGALYFATWSKVLRYTLDSALVPTAPPDTVVTGMPLLEHGARSIAVTGNDLYVNIGVASNACERDYPKRDFTGDYPCRELGTSGGIWRFDTRQRGQRPSPTTRYATGLRHTIALGVNPRDGALYGAPHGIDHLESWWPNAGYSASDAANIPSETLFRIESGGDYGFPYCMHDPRSNRMIVAPAYAQSPVTDRCAAATRPIATFPAHSAPMALAWSVDSVLPAAFRGGVFVALHGSLFHAPEEPRGYAVFFVDSTSAVRPFASARRRLGNASARPSGLAWDGKGGLLMADDYGQRVYLIRRQ
jgi:glucose/arabinose dehydrogenase